MEMWRMEMWRVEVQHWSDACASALCLPTSERSVVQTQRMSHASQGAQRQAQIRGAVWEKDRLPKLRPMDEELTRVGEVRGRGVGVEWGGNGSRKGEGGGKGIGRVVVVVGGGGGGGGVCVCCGWWW